MPLLTIPLQWGFPKNTAEGLLSAGLEITALTQLVPNTPLLLALFAALLAFGGICVHLQIFTITGGRLSLCWMLSLRVLAGGLAAGFCWIGCQVFPNAVVSPEICSVSAPAVQYSRTTPIASCFWWGQRCFYCRQQQNNGNCANTHKKISPALAGLTLSSGDFISSM